MKNNNIEKTEFLKIVYFDEAAAQDYVDVTNGGRLDWSTQENKEKIAKIVAEIEAQAKSGFNILNYIKATFQGKVDASASAELTSAFDKTIKNTLLTDYIQAASKDEHVKKFENSGVYAPENSVTLYKMVSSYLTIVPKEEMPIDMEKLNEAILGERGYYDMLLKTAKLDDGNKKMDVFVNIPGQPEPKSKKKKKPRVQDFIIHADEYCSVQEHVIINFINFIFQMSITNMYIQNPPKNIREQIYRTFDKSIIHETQQPYLEVSKEEVQDVMEQLQNSSYNKSIVRGEI